MQWVYSLLRNNQETGPYTFNELLDQHLRPTDLIWVEGRSQAWCYPSEVPELKSYFEGTAYQRPVAPAPQQISSLPDEIEQRAEELRQRVLSFTPKYYSPKTESKSTTYSDTLYVIEEGKIHFVDHRKKEVPAYEWLSAAMVTFLVVAGIYGGHRLLSSGTTLLPTVASKAVTVDDHEAKVVAKKINQPVVTANYTESAPDSIYTDSALMKSDSVQTKQSAGTKLANR